MLVCSSFFTSSLNFLYCKYDMIIHMAPNFQQCLSPFISLCRAGQVPGTDREEQHRLLLPKHPDDYTGCGDLMAALLLAHTHATPNDLVRPLPLQPSYSALQHRSQPAWMWPCSLVWRFIPHSPACMLTDCCTCSHLPLSEQLPRCKR